MNRIYRISGKRNQLANAPFPILSILFILSKYLPLSTRSPSPIPFHNSSFAHPRMSASFRNTLVPGDAVRKVCADLMRANAAEGYSRVGQRLLFERAHEPHERRFILIWNGQWCVVLSDLAEEDPAWLRNCLREHPAVVQLWARDGGWGYRLEECGTLNTSFCSKPNLEEPDEPQPGTHGDVERLARVCGHPGAARRLQRLERRWSMFDEIPPGWFADALGCPVARLPFYEVDVANAGNAFERQVQGWKLQLLAFRKPPASPLPLATPSSVEAPELINPLSEEDRAEVARLRRRLRRFRWLRVFTVPLTALLGLFLMVVIPTIMLGHMLLFGWPRRFQNRFIAALDDMESGQRRIEQGRVYHCRHLCSVAFRPPAVAHVGKVRHHPPFRDETVFEFKIGSLFLNCTAYRPGQVPVWGQATVLEERTFEVDGRTGTFRKLRFPSRHRPEIDFQWIIVLEEAVYRFHCGADADTKPEELAEAEAIVLSFRVEQPERSTKDGL